MTEIKIPIAVAGPGSQPAGADGSELDILQMPSGMHTFVAPSLPGPEQVQGLSAAMSVLKGLHSELRTYRIDQPAVQLDLDVMDGENRELVDRVLGEGEVSVIFAGEVKAHIQESVLAGVWRIRYLDGDERLLADTIEVAAIPHLVTESTFARAAPVAAAETHSIPDGVRNAPPLLAEINDRLAAYRVGDDAHVINLTLLPQTEQDLAFLAERLGQVRVSILSRGYGNCRIVSTGTRFVWWVQCFNSRDKNVLNSLEITQVPSVACAAQEDIRDSAERLGPILEAHQ